MSQLQLDLSKRITEAHIQVAVDHANAVHENWSDHAFDFLKGYSEINTTFMGEDVRNASKGLVPDPPSERAWGGIILRAAHQGLIVKHGMRKVKNIKAHQANATVWRSLIVKRY